MTVIEELNKRIKILEELLDRNTKQAKLIGFVRYNGKQFNEWRCPNEECGFMLEEVYKYCPYCGQRVYFPEV